MVRGNPWWFGKILSWGDFLIEINHYPITIESFNSWPFKIIQKNSNLILLDTRKTAAPSFEPAYFYYIQSVIDLRLQLSEPWIGLSNSKWKFQFFRKWINEYWDILLLGIMRFAKFELLVGTLEQFILPFQFVQTEVSLPKCFQSNSFRFIQNNSGSLK